MNATETKIITLEEWNSATTEQRAEWLRQGVLTDRSPVLPRYEKKKFQEIN